MYLFLKKPRGTMNWYNIKTEVLFPDSWCLVTSYGSVVVNVHRRPVGIHPFVAKRTLWLNRKWRTRRVASLSIVCNCWRSILRIVGFLRALNCAAALQLGKSRLARIAQCNRFTVCIFTLWSWAFIFTVQHKSRVTFRPALVFGDESRS